MTPSSDIRRPANISSAQANLAGLLLFAAATLLAACGGGGGGSPTQPPPPPPPPRPQIIFNASPPPQAPSLSLAGTQDATGTMLTVELMANSVDDLYGIAFDLSFPSDILELDSSSEGDFLDDGGTTQTTFQIAEPADGQLIVGLSRLGNVVGADGSGVLLLLNFRSVASGSGSFVFSTNVGFDSLGQELNLSWAAGSVTVTT